ncbi:hypothetical protein QPK87_31635 [Kamptonema cortianum]|nr:hypothetical protein [Geitlerinema splendidum]MDK3161077.1 hypothetical protein [Kamptonema cortianum]
MILKISKATLFLPAVLASLTIWLLRLPSTHLAWAASDIAQLAGKACLTLALLAAVGSVFVANRASQQAKALGGFRNLDDSSKSFLYFSVSITCTLIVIGSCVPLLMTFSETN